MFCNKSSLQSMEEMCNSMQSQGFFSAEPGSPSPGSPAGDAPLTDSPPASPSAEAASPPPRRRASTDDSGTGSGSDDSLPGGGGGGAGAGAARRPARTVFSAAQMAALEREYAGNRYLSTPQRRQLSRRLQLAEATVKVWFQNRRMKEKRQQSETQMHYLSQVMHSYMYQLHCAGVAPPPAIASPMTSPLPYTPVTSPMFGSVTSPACGPLTPPPTVTAVSSVASASDCSPPPVTSPLQMTSPSSQRRPKARSHAHLFRPYAL